MFLCCVESLSWFRSKLDFLRIFKATPKLSGQSHSTIVQGFYEKMTIMKKSFLLHFLIPVHVHVQCSIMH